MWSPHQLSFSHLPALFAWLGFTNAFCQFVCRGWILAACGTSLLLISMVFAKPRQEMDLLRTSIRTLMFVGGLGLLIAWYSPLRASVLLNRAASLTSRGDHVTAVEQLERAARVWRPLSEDTDFIVQHGLSDLAAHRSTPYARLYQARLLERDGQGDLAISIYRQLTENELAESPIRREACRGALRYAERAANAGQWHQALAGATFVTQHDPCNIKALYASLVCCMQLGDACGADKALKQLQSVYGFLNYPNKRIVLAKAREMTVKTLLQQRLTQGRPGANWQTAVDAFNLSALPPQLTFAP
jgi:tetratricopeptide (TPR) repeat protein